MTRAVLAAVVLIVAVAAIATPSAAGDAGILYVKTDEHLRTEAVMKISNSYE